jgi:hypothetical protein
MAYRVEVIANVAWVPDGTGGVTMGVAESNVPGVGAALAAGTVPNAQTLRWRVAEAISGGDSLTGTNLQAALTQAGTDLYTLVTAAMLAQMQAWKTGGA